jgi:adenine/guanine phosphoribosyltransferase-like PRPP-binding protein
MISELIPSHQSTVTDSVSTFGQTDAPFYREYAWALNIYPRVADSLDHLRAELHKFLRADEMLDWQLREVLTNIFLHCGAISDTLDDFLLGPAYDFSKLSSIPFSGVGISAFDRGMKVSRMLRKRRFAAVHRWRKELHDAFREFLATALIPETSPSTALVKRMSELTERKLPQELLDEVAKVPAALRSQDMSYPDVLTLGKSVVERTTDRNAPTLIVGLRTAGSYFAPLLAAFLSVNGFSDVDWLTIRPKKGLADWERGMLSAYSSRKGSRALIIDEPVNTGKTLLKTIDLLSKAGFGKNVITMVPVHPSRRDWDDGFESKALSRNEIVTLLPEDWHKRTVISQDHVAKLMSRWLAGEKAAVSVSIDAKAADFNRELAEISEEKFHNRLKQVYRVDVRREGYAPETRYVLAKSVGCGWLGYHAVLASERLSSFVPPLIGYSDGILFQEWIEDDGANEFPDRHYLVQRSADYISERVKNLRLDHDPVKALAADNRHKSSDELSSMLSKAYGSRPASMLQRAGLRARLSGDACSFPTLVDGKMRPVEWVNGTTGLVKTDFEQHGLGKTELNAVDPAYDLAETILHWQLTRKEEQELLDRYIANTGDSQVQKRLHLQKLMAGTWQMMRAGDNLKDARLAKRADDFNWDYLAAWNFLIIHTLRYVGDLCIKDPNPSWHSPLVVMDIDGVIDKQIFGFPSTTAAGIRAISLLHAHNYALAANSARSVTEIEEYCSAYHMVGGVAEYGAYAWDALSGKSQVLISSESQEQIATLVSELRKIPGVFLNDDYKYSIRAFTYSKGVTVALPTLLIQNLMSSLKLDRLAFHQTFLDTAVVSKETDKGKGMNALLALANQPREGTIAIGDSEPDLPMFQAASRSYAPGHISCKPAARMVGCKFGNGTYQLGLLDIARRIVHEKGGSCAQCARCDELLSQNSDLFVEMLKVADVKTLPSLVKSALNPWALASFKH